MRGIWSVVGRAYLSVGGMLASILWCSYAWRGTWGAPSQMGFMEHTAFAGLMVGIGTLGGFLRLLFWPISLAAFVLEPGHPSIVHWLATGLDGGTVSAP